VRANGKRMDASHRELPELADVVDVQDQAVRSFEDFYRDEHAGVFGSLVLLTRNRADAEELMQEAFLRVWERWDDLHDLDDPTGYLYRTAMNAAFSRRRRAKVAARKLLRPDPPPDPLEELEHRDAIDHALDHLTQRQRAAVVLCDLLGFASGEAADAMRIAPSTIRVLLARGRETMRRELRSL
jgi:RNA polymerase sigma-70 factor, ECF subfamily